mmetsp:Transcript_8570/g.19034  ORF Transcript_8570/g.19034 Transcript_8570/m.19034 type:complete len:399 (+) Transcript_8570:151-1347(+)
MNVCPRSGSFDSVSAPESPGCSGGALVEWSLSLAELGIRYLRDTPRPLGTRHMSVPAGSSGMEKSAISNAKALAGAEVPAHRASSRRLHRKRFPRPSTKSARPQMPAWRWSGSGEASPASIPLPASSGAVPLGQDGTASPSATARIPATLCQTSSTRPPSRDTSIDSSNSRSTARTIWACVRKPTWPQSQKSNHCPKASASRALFRLGIGWAPRCSSLMRASIQTNSPPWGSSNSARVIRPRPDLSHWLQRSTKPSDASAAAGPVSIAGDPVVAGDFTSAASMVSTLAVSLASASGASTVSGEPLEAPSEALEPPSVDSQASLSPVSVSSVESLTRNEASSLSRSMGSTTVSAPKTSSRLRSPVRSMSIASNHAPGELRMSGNSRASPKEARHTGQRF